jgi:hypothetical protein
MRRGLSMVALAATVSLSSLASAWGQGSLGGFRLFKQVEADPNNSYPLSEQNGPWMIMAATFASSPGRDEMETQKLRQEAAAQAQELVYELRKHHKLDAYTFLRRPNPADATVQGRGVDRQGRPLRMQYQRQPVGEEIAVLIGNYTAVDSPDAERDLKVVKDIEPKSLHLAELHKQGRSTYQQLAGWRLSQKTVTPQQFKAANAQQAWQFLKNLQINNTTRQYGPMGSAFISRNPMLPKEQQGPFVDKVVYDMNKEVRYSLLDCPGKYTLQVATFTGSVIVDQKRIRDLEKGQGKLNSRLEDAALKAHKLTEALRVKGYEAYEFHDRCASIVTVGSFDSVGTPRPDGRIEINPKLHQHMQAFGPEPGGRPKSLVEIPFDVQPLPVTVPRRSVSSDYAIGGMLSGWAR